MRPSRLIHGLSAGLLALLVLAGAAGDAGAHDKVGANLNFIGDFRRNHEFVDVVKQSRRLLKLGTFDDQSNANLAPLGADGWPTTDFRILAMAAQQDTAALAGTYKIVFNGSANLATGGEGTITNKVFTAGTNTTTADLNFPAGAQNLIVDFTSTGGTVKNVRIIRPGYDPGDPPLLHTPWRNHAQRFPVLRFLDWTRTNGNRSIAWADRTTNEKLKTEAYIARWETVIAAANAMGTDAWINVPVQANDEYVTELATLFRDTLDPSLNLYVEYGNELWNFSIRDFDMDTINGGTFFNGATVNRDLAAASPGGSPLRYDGESNATTLGFRRVALRLKEISDIFRSVWGTPAINTRVRPVLAGQMANSFIVSEGLRMIDEGLDVRPDTVFYAISGAPYIFPSAIPDGNSDEGAGLTSEQILNGLAQGVANAPNENAYQYLTHAGLGAWYGLKVVAYEAGFDNFGSNTIAAKREANLAPAIRNICRALVDQWHGFGFEHILWFNSGADSYDTPFGMWPLVEDMSNQAVPKNQCIDDVLAAPLPAITIGTPVVGAAIAGHDYRGASPTTGALSGLDSNFGFPGFVEYLLRADVAGTYKLVFTGNAPSGESFRLKLNNATVSANVSLPTSNGNSVTINVTLRKGLNAMRIERAVGASWSIASFAFTPPSRIHPDFDASGKADLPFANADGRAAIWLMDGLATTATQELIGPATGWSIVQLGDFDGDGKTDLVWQNTDGRMALYLMNGTVPAATQQMLNAGGGWSVTHTPDLDGDGKSDLLFQNTDGTVAVWTMNGFAITAGSSIIGAGTGFSVVHTGDFDGDGKADLVWRHTDGRHAIWLMDGTTVKATNQILNAATGWSVTHVADLDGDGKSDLVWQNTDGSIAVWLMDGAAMASGSGILGSGSGFSVTRTGDFDGDGKADLFFLHTDGRAAIWLMDGLVPTATNQILNAGGGWSAARVQDLDGDGKADIVWQNVDGSVALWLMDGTTMTSGTGILGPGTGWSVSAVSP
jgi:isocitrate dehydrogenase